MTRETIRRVKHHAGQPNASLRRIGEEPVWVGRGWRKTRIKWKRG